MSVLERAGCVNGTVIELRSGLFFDPLEPEESTFTIQDIAHGLANTCRFNGQCSEFYSVAQHSVLVSRWLEEQCFAPHVRLQGLLHDASEAYIADVSRPVKHAPQFAAYRAVEARLQEAIYRWSMLCYWKEFHHHIAKADAEVCRAEAIRLMPSKGEAWGWGGIQPASITIVPWSPSAARREFIGEYRELNETIREAER